MAPFDSKLVLLWASLRKYKLKTLNKCIHFLFDKFCYISSSLLSRRTSTESPKKNQKTIWDQCPPGLNGGSSNLEDIICLGKYSEFGGGLLSRDRSIASGCLWSSYNW